MAGNTDNVIKSTAKQMKIAEIRKYYSYHEDIENDGDLILKLNNRLQEYQKIADTLDKRARAAEKELEAVKQELERSEADRENLRDELVTYSERIAELEHGTRDAGEPNKIEITVPKNLDYITITFMQKQEEQDNE